MKSEYWVHVVWSTKHRQPFLQNGIRQLLFEHIRENAANKNIHLEAVGGYTDHVHVLICMNAEDELSRIVQLIKGESSYWINKTKLIQDRFAWQTDYYAQRVQGSAVFAVIGYIGSQESHHKRKSFNEEYRELIEGFIAGNGG